MTTKALVIVVTVVAALLAGVVYLHMPRHGKAARLPPSLHSTR
jgi:hypothetical protein